MQRFSVVEVPDARFLAGDLFRRTFGGDPPEIPRHFVCLYQPEPGTFRTAGYVHFSPMEGVWLAGGLVADKALYPSIPREHLAELGPRPSIGEYVMREGIERLGECFAVFAYIGDERSIAVNRDVGYVPTHIEHVYACWRKQVPPAIQRAAAERVAKLAPF
jgi:hypothetical protein